MNMVFLIQTDFSFALIVRFCFSPEAPQPVGLQVLGYFGVKLDLFVQVEVDYTLALGHLKVVIYADIKLRVVKILSFFFFGWLGCSQHLFWKKLCKPDNLYDSIAIFNQQVVCSVLGHKRTCFNFGVGILHHQDNRVQYFNCFIFSGEQLHLAVLFNAYHLLEVRLPSLVKKQNT